MRKILTNERDKRDKNFPADSATGFGAQWFTVSVLI